MTRLVAVLVAVVGLCAGCGLCGSPPASTVPTRPTYIVTTPTGPLHVIVCSTDCPPGHEDDDEHLVPVDPVTGLPLP